jgi:hypothetical protein
LLSRSCRLTCCREHRPGADTEPAGAQGGLTDLWLDDPYVVAASKLIAWAEEANAAGEVYPVWGTCLGHQLLQILATNASFEELLVETDAVVCPHCPAARRSRPYNLPWRFGMQGNSFARGCVLGSMPAARSYFGHDTA